MSHNNAYCYLDFQKGGEQCDSSVAYDESKNWVDESSVHDINKVEEVLEPSESINTKTLMMLIIKWGRLYNESISRGFVVQEEHNKQRNVE